MASIILLLNSSSSNSKQKGMKEKDTAVEEGTLKTTKSISFILSKFMCSKLKGSQKLKERQSKED